MIAPLAGLATTISRPGVCDMKKAAWNAGMFWEKFALFDVRQYLCNVGLHASGATRSSQTNDDSMAAADVNVVVAAQLDRP